MPSCWCFYQREAADQWLMISIRRRSRGKCDFPNFIQMQHTERFRSPESMFASFAWVIKAFDLKSDVICVRRGCWRPLSLVISHHVLYQIQRRSRCKCDFPNFIQTLQSRPCQDLNQIHLIIVSRWSLGPLPFYSTRPSASGWPEAGSGHQQIGVQNKIDSKNLAS